MKDFFLKNWRHRLSCCIEYEKVCVRISEGFYDGMYYILSLSLVY